MRKSTDWLRVDFILICFPLLAGNDFTSTKFLTRSIRQCVDLITLSSIKSTSTPPGQLSCFMHFLFYFIYLLGLNRRFLFLPQKIGHRQNRPTGSFGFVVYDEKKKKLSRLS